DTFADPTRLAQAIKRLPLRLLRPRPLDEAISSAGGVRWDELDERLMLRQLPGVFCAGEMLDWEAPTGGYLLTACCSTGPAAGRVLRSRAAGLARADRRLSALGPLQHRAGRRSGDVGLAGRTLTRRR